MFLLAPQILWTIYSESRLKTPSVPHWFPISFPALEICAARRVEKKPQGFFQGTLWSNTANPTFIKQTPAMLRVLSGHSSNQQELVRSSSFGFISENHCWSCCETILPTSTSLFRTPCRPANLPRAEPDPGRPRYGSRTGPSE